MSLYDKPLLGRFNEDPDRSKHHHLDRDRQKHFNIGSTINPLTGKPNAVVLINIQKPIVGGSSRRFCPFRYLSAEHRSTQDVLRDAMDAGFCD
jgi:hypothetical protein